MPLPLPTVTYQVAGGSLVMLWATVKLWSRDQAAWIT